MSFDLISNRFFYFEVVQIFIQLFLKLNIDLNQYSYLT